MRRYHTKHRAQHAERARAKPCHRQARRNQNPGTATRTRQPPATKKFSPCRKRCYTAVKTSCVQPKPCAAQANTIARRAASTVRAPHAEGVLCLCTCGLAGQIGPTLGQLSCTARSLRRIPGFMYIHMHMGGGGQTGPGTLSDETAHHRRLVSSIRSSRVYIISSSPPPHPGP